MAAPAPVARAPHYRLLLPLERAGAVIGKAGAVIAGIQAVTGASVVVGHHLPSATERVVHVSGGRGADGRSGGPQAVVAALRGLLGVLDAAAGEGADSGEPAIARLLLFACEAVPEPLLAAAQAPDGHAVAVAYSPAAPAGGGGVAPGALPDDWVLMLHGPATAVKAALTAVAQVLQRLPGPPPSAVAAALAASRTEGAAGGAGAGPKRKRAAPDDEHAARPAGSPLPLGVPRRSSSSSDASSASAAPEGLVRYAASACMAGGRASACPVEALASSYPRPAQPPPPRHRLALAREAGDSGVPGARGPAPHNTAVAAMFESLPPAVRTAFDGNASVDVVGLSGAAGVELRLLVPARRVGLVLGERGANIKRMRSKYPHALINVMDAAPGGDERVLQVASAECAGEASCAAVMAAVECGDLLLHDTRRGPSGDQAALRLLLTKSQLGAVLGPRGCTVKAIRCGSGADLRNCAVESPAAGGAPPPHGARRGDEELRISGSVQGVMQALFVVATAIRACEARSQLRLGREPPVAVTPAMLAAAERAQHAGQAGGSDQEWREQPAMAAQALLDPVLAQPPPPPPRRLQQQQPQQLQQLHQQQQQQQPQQQSQDWGHEQLGQLLAQQHVHQQAQHHHHSQRQPAACSLPAAGVAYSPACPQYSEHSVAPLAPLAPQPQLPGLQYWRQPDAPAACTGGAGEQAPDALQHMLQQLAAAGGLGQLAVGPAHAGQQHAASAGVGAAALPAALQAAEPQKHVRVEVTPQQALALAPKLDSVKQLCNAAVCFVGANAVGTLCFDAVGAEREVDAAVRMMTVLANLAA